MESKRSSNSIASPWSSPKVIANHRRRKRIDVVLKVVVGACIVAVLAPLGDMLLMFAYKGVQVLSVTSLFNGLGDPTPGLSTAVIGTGILTLLGAAIAIPLGLFGGIYMAEFAKGSRYSGGLRFAADVLAGVPSIILGYSLYLILVSPFGLHWGYSALAGGIALAVIMFPYIFRTTEIAIRKVPEAIKEGAIALGSTKTTMINRLVLRFALPGIITGILLAIGIALSETAPLLYTASFASYVPTHLTGSPTPYLTGLIWFDYTSPVQAYVNLAYLATFLLILIVLSLNIVARVGLRRLSKV